jgi:hypothetical protein
MILEVEHGHALVDEELERESPVGMGAITRLPLLIFQPLGRRVPSDRRMPNSVNCCARGFLSIRVQMVARAPLLLPASWL